MHQWFRKGNARRFHRVDMPVRHFIVPSSPITDREIYATGADYFPSLTRSRIEAAKFATESSLSKIQDQKELISRIVGDIVADIEFFGFCIEKISHGQNPKRDPNYWMKINDKLEGFQTIKMLKESSPKTYQYLALIEEKYLAFLNRLVHSINESTSEHFAVEGHLPVGFKLEEIIQLFKQEKFAKIPLVQTILHLSEYLEAYLDVYRQINDDNYLKQFPQQWPLENANISASGIAVFLPKLFTLYSKVDVHLYFEADDKLIFFEGNVVDLREHQGQLQRIAINFEFPNGNDQNYIQQEIQKQEVKECMKFAFY